MAGSHQKKTGVETSAETSYSCSSNFDQCEK